MLVCCFRTGWHCFIRFGLADGVRRFGDCGIFLQFCKCRSDSVSEKVLDQLFCAENRSHIGEIEVGRLWGAVFPILCSDSGWRC